MISGFQSCVNKWDKYLELIALPHFYHHFSELSILSTRSYSESDLMRTKNLPRIQNTICRNLTEKTTIYSPKQTIIVCANYVYSDIFNSQGVPKLNSFTIGLFQPIIRVLVNNPARVYILILL